MPRGGAHFSSAELAKVLSHYDIGVIDQVKAFTAGNRRAPKVIINSEKGKFLLKRRQKGKDDLHRVSFAHAVHNHLAKKRFTVAALLPTLEQAGTLLHLDNHVYELFEYIEGSRYDGSAEVTIDAGRRLANLHRFLADFAGREKPLKGSFHDSSKVRRHLKSIGSKKTNTNNKKLLAAAQRLMELYNLSSVRVNELGFDSWPKQVIHGDWHPGNMLFAKRRLAAVLDFDSTKIAPPATDIANGMLQFSIVGNRPNPADWPAYLDQAKLVQFLNGYREVSKLDKSQTDSLLDLMIETIIAEAVLPVAATGFFGNLSGTDFLKMIRRKAEWIHKNGKTLRQAMRS
ncbi:MAG: phosphotransferase [Planctomycetota bacterium]|jgi:homoserine kinase type II